MTTLLSILLQTTTFEPDTTSTTVTTVTKVGEDLNLFGLLEKGGWVMIPIFVLFFIALFLFVER